MNTTQTSPSKTSWWPKFIILGYILFIAYIGNFVRMAMSSDVDLVSKDYYKQEIAYQQHINTVTNTKANNAEIQVTLAEAAGQLVIAFPEFYQGRKVNGKVSFFRPSDAKLDFETTLNLNEARQQFLPVDKLERGLWKVRVNSEVNGKNYFTEQTITLK
ncbi:FixH family protein [Adhaeribacter soli]|uniref:Nitrogen fixation protein FixH n=1 Tax=Adhaeribacter soli TaxID=2607655 RepID=A0A5N1J4W0_9BACT|nr:FixH family protein [Adhaeribacter soli]KAA9345734.1 nitrogen fixation protein FixH [Adhaeribacter soli]